MSTDVIGGNENRRGVTCEFCECALSASGEVMKRSARARAFLDLDDDNAKLRAKVESLQAEVSAANARVEALQAQVAIQPAPTSSAVGSSRFADLD